MKVRAVIFEIYGTLLEVDPTPAGAAVRWDRLCQRHFPGPPPMSLASFSRCSGEVMLRQRAELQAKGIRYPELIWPDIACQAMPELAALTRAGRDDFLFNHAQLQRAVRPLPRAVETLRELRQRRLVLGLASNCQAYTLRELEIALSRVNFSMAHFRRDLHFFSFQAGFRKPDPYVFRWLTARLHDAAVTPAETLVVGSQPDTDIFPAQTQDFQTWLLTNKSGDGQSSGDWGHLSAWLKTNLT